MEVVVGLGLFLGYKDPSSYRVRVQLHCTTSSTCMTGVVPVQKHLRNYAMPQKKIQGM